MDVQLMVLVADGQVRIFSLGYSAINCGVRNVPNGTFANADRF
jgi:hypothetical protein